MLRMATPTNLTLPLLRLRARRREYFKVLSCTVSPIDCRGEATTFVAGAVPQYRDAYCPKYLNFLKDLALLLRPMLAE
jgi:hypothetical protein